MTNPAVTWILPVRNGMPWITETLASIQNQTYFNHQILVWENGSTDGTLEELRNWIPSRIKGRVVTGEPLRLGPSLARAIEEAGTELCAVIHADDVSAPQRLAKQVPRMLANPALGVLGTGIQFVNGTGQIWPCPERFPVSDADIRWELKWSNPVAHPTVMLRRSVVIAAGNYRDFQPFEDHELWLRIARIAEVENLPDVLLSYRKHPQSVSALADPDYFRYYRIVAEMHAADLFPGLEAGAALSLREQSSLFGTAPVSILDFARYKRAAEAAAAAIGKPRDYFRNATPYKYHQKQMIRNMTVQNPLGRALLQAKRALGIRM